ncbi:MAG: DUF7144 family membrane protein [Candidatus Jordarchaeum sp.]|uniref:DUF7144 family membrane protein n=1 Tax=Candidatus Jordarchaeum sp. TaxID=2823881 RepID=UPI00404B1D2B
MDVYRPRSVIALVVILIIVAVLSIVGSMLILTLVLPALSDGLYFATLRLTLFYNLPLDLLSKADLWLTLSKANQLIVAYSSVAWIALIFGVLNILTVIGLIYMKIWGRYLGIILGTMAIIMSLAFFVIKLFNSHSSICYDFPSIWNSVDCILIWRCKI